MLPLNVFIISFRHPGDFRAGVYVIEDRNYGCLIKDFRHGERGMSPLNSSIDYKEALPPYKPVRAQK
ncbi:MAG: hypothetical protein WAO75_10900, partial [Atribacterales bacterium]